MTDLELQEYYADLLILQYRGQPKAYATIQELAKMVIMNQLPVDVQNAFDVETAVGVQLDVIGKYVGVIRYATGPSGRVYLDDDDMRTLIKLVIIKNHTISSLAVIQSLLATLFPGQIRISDNSNMSLQYTLTESLGSDELLYVIENGGYLPKPMGVGITVTVVPDFDTTYFSYRTYGAPATGFAPYNSYNFYIETYPWITYLV